MRLIKRSCNVLIIGCGTSDIAEMMYDSGYHQITNNDASVIAIKHMKRRNETLRPEIEWDVMDVKDMRYRDNTYDLIIDKGTLDNMLCYKLPYFSTANMLSECQRVLKTGGTYVAISFGAPD